MEEKMSFENFNVLDFGADPTGNDSSWQAFKDWSIAISNAGGGVGLVPAGTYLIDKFTEIYEPGSPDDFRFEGCDGLWLIGYGANLNLKLKEEVQLNLLLNGAIDKHMVCPFYIHNCHNVCLEGFDINGHVDQVQFNGVIEPGGHCVTIENSTHVTIRHMRLHHSWTDGINVRAAFTETRLACRNIVIENCEIYDNVRACIAVHETRHVRISDCRIYDSGMGIDIEPDLRIGQEFDKDIRPPGSSRFTIIENCEIYNNEKPLSVSVRYSQVRVQGCFIDNQRNNQQPVILNVPHCALLDCEINTGTGRIDVALSGADPGDNVFTMERCLIRATSGEGLYIAPDVGRIAQALIANCRFICEATSPTTASFPCLSTGRDMLMLTFRDNYTFIPAASYDDSALEDFKVCSTVLASLAENNVWETNYPSGGKKYMGVFYHTDFSIYPRYPVLIRNERFISGYNLRLRLVDTIDGLDDKGRNLVIVALVSKPEAPEEPEKPQLHIRIFDGSGTRVIDKKEDALISGETLTNLKNQLTPIPAEPGLSKEQKQQIVTDATLIAGHPFLSTDSTAIRPLDAPDHNNYFPFSGGISAIGDEINLGKQRIKYGGVSAPTSGSFNQGDLIFNSNVKESESMGWVCVVKGTAGVDAKFKSMPPVGV
jgi:Right handed beta helix region